MSTIEIGGLNEDDFRRSIENRLREGKPGIAIERLRTLLMPYAGPGGLLPERFLAVDAGDLDLRGWDLLGEAIRRRDQPGRLITAVSIAIGWPGEDAPGPDAEGRLRPHLETSFFSDNAYPFSQSRREDLLEGYSFYGSTWSGDAEATDSVLSLEGVDDLHGALHRLESDLLASEEPDEDGVRAGSLGACLLSVLLVEAVGKKIASEGLPRPLCVMAGCNDVYPYFDAPVVGMPEDALPDLEAEEAALVSAHGGAPPPRYSSLLITKISHAPKRAVLVLDESEDETARRVSRLRSGMAGLQADSPGEGSRAAQAPEPSPTTPALDFDTPLLAKKPPRPDAGPPDGLDPVLQRGEVCLSSHPADPAWDDIVRPFDLQPMRVDAEERALDAIAEEGDFAPFPDPQEPDSDHVDAVDAPRSLGDLAQPVEHGRTDRALQQLRAKAAAQAAHPSIIVRITRWLRGKSRSLIG